MLALSLLKKPPRIPSNRCIRTYGTHPSPTRRPRRTVPPRVAIIGSGPAGFYTAHRLLQLFPKTLIDMYEALPAPYGLVRFGVAPDHPEVKNCQHTFSLVANKPNFRYIGNIRIGLPSDPGTLPLASLVPHYHALVLAYGASKDKKLNIPGEDTVKGIYSARDFVGWYNGNPEFRDLDPDLQSGQDAVIIGQGNVAFDVARMLLSDVDRLRKTDIADYALEKLARSRVRTVTCVGRRGPLQASFTARELRELIALPSVTLAPIGCPPLPPKNLTSTFPRKTKRILEVLQRNNASPRPSPLHPKNWSLEFLLTPTKFNSHPTTNRLQSIKFQHGELPPPPEAYSPSCSVSMKPRFTTFPTSLAFKSIGYLAEPLPGSQHLGIPFNPKLGLIPNEDGRVVIPQELDAAQDFLEVGTIRVPGVYVAGWVKRGPTGVIGSTMIDAYETAEAIVEDWAGANEVPMADMMDYGGGEKRGWEALEEEARARGCRPVSWAEWETIDACEERNGMAVGKPRVKFASVGEMMECLGGGANGEEGVKGEEGGESQGV